MGTKILSLLKKDLVGFKTASGSWKQRLKKPTRSLKPPFFRELNFVPPFSLQPLIKTEIKAGVDPTLISHHKNLEEMGANGPPLVGKLNTVRLR